MHLRFAPDDLTLSPEGEGVMFPAALARGGLMLLAETFDFSQVRSDQSSAGAGDLTGAASALDLSWVHQAALEGGQIGTLMTDLGGFDPDGFDFHSPEMISAEQLAPLDQAAALGADWMWVG